MTSETDTQLPYRAEIQRKALHLLALVVPAGMVLLGKVPALMVLVPLAALAVASDVLRVRSAGVGAFIGRWFAFMMRAEEQPPHGGPVVINGATWVLLSAVVLTLVFPIRIAVPAFVSFMIADAVAALVGRRYGRIHWGRSPRTVEGSAAFLVSGLAVIALFPGLHLGVAAAGVVVGCLAEALPGPFNDNLRVPIVIATVIFVLELYVLDLPVYLFFGPPA